MDYQKTVDFLYAKLPMFQKIGGAALKFNLNNIHLLMQRLSNPHKKVKTIHIAGTNGKGSSAHMVASVLQAAGYKTGLFTSPHLKSLTERMRINGQEIPQQEVITFVDEIIELIDEIKPSFFEITFAMAMQYFYRFKVDIAVIEVGMGGRLDSTNIIVPEICLITNISEDHQQYLGHSLAEIAVEKAGIFKPGVPIIISEKQEVVMDVFIEQARAMECELSFADQHICLEQASANRYNIIAGDKILLEGLQPDLKGPYQLPNIIGVVALILALRHKTTFAITDGALQTGLESVILNTGLKGRWQVLNEQPLVIADTGHNRAGIQQIADELARLEHNNLHIVWGMVNDKGGEELMQLLPKEAIYYFVEAYSPRAMAVTKLAKVAAELGLSGKVYPSVKTGYRAALEQALVDDMIFIGGSTFVVAEIDDL